MRNYWKRSLSLLIAVFMVVGMLPVTAFAAEVTDAAKAVVGDTITVKGNKSEPAASEVEGTHWEGPVQSTDVTCGKISHPEHTDDCYVTAYDNCTHSHGMSCIWDCSHPEHTDACISGEELGEGCVSRHWVQNGWSGSYQYYEHTHEEPACYTYTWTLAWNTYTVTFQDEDGTEISSETYTHGDEISVPDDLDGYEADGKQYTFAGWDSNGDKIAESISSAIEKVTYTAIFTAQSVYTVTFDANGGSAVPSLPVIGGKKIASEPTTTMEGAQLDGWYTTDGDEWDFANDTVEGNITLIAKWLYDSTVENTAGDSVTVKVNGEALGNGAFVTVPCGTSVTVSATANGNNTYIKELSVGNNKVTPNGTTGNVNFTAGDDVAYSVSVTTDDAIKLSGQTISYNPNDEYTAWEDAIKELVTVYGQHVSDLKVEYLTYSVFGDDSWGPLSESSDGFTIPIINFTVAAYSFGDAEIETVKITWTAGTTTYIWQGDITLDETREVADIQVLADQTVEFGYGVNKTTIKQRIFNAIYDKANSVPSDLTVDDVTIEVSATGVVYNDVTTDTGYGFTTAAGLGGIVNARIVLKDHNQYQDDTSDSVKVTLVDNRKTITVGNTAVTVSYNTDGQSMFNEMVAEIGTSYEGVSYTADNAALMAAAQDSKDNKLTVYVSYTGDDEYKTLIATAVTVSFEGAWYTVSWYDEDGENGEQGALLDTTDALIGTTPTHADTSKEDTAQYTYTFAGWEAVSGVDSETGYITGNASYKATFTETVNKYTVTWYDQDGTTKLYEISVNYGTDVSSSYNGEKTTEQLAADKYTAQYTYTFDKWVVGAGIEAGKVIATADYTASYTSEINKYTIKFVSHDGTEEKTVEYGQIPEYTTPSDYEDKVNNLYYSFQGWDSEVGTVTGDATYKAVYTDKSVYTVTFEPNGVELNVDNTKRVVEGAAVAALDVPERKGYRFGGWYLNGAEYDFTTPVTDNITLTAKWVQLVTVTFETDGAGEIESQTFDIGGKATEPDDPTKDQAIFGGWYLGNAETAYVFATPVTKNITLTAKWLADTNNNNVADDQETITINVNKANDADTVTIGETTLAAGKNTYVFDSTATDKTITIKATPVVSGYALTGYVSTTYVAGITVNGAETENIGSYGDKYVYTYTFTAADEQNVTVNFAEAEFEKRDSATMTFYQGVELPNYENLYKAAIEAPEYNADAVKSVTYLARPAGEYDVNVSAIGEALADIDIIGGVLKNFFDSVTNNGYVTVTLGEKWLEVATEIEDGDLQEIIDDAVADMVAKIEAGDYEGAIESLESLGSIITTKAGTIGCREFGEVAETAVLDADGNVVETLHVIYSSEAMRIEDKTITITLKDNRDPSCITGANVSLMYEDYLEAEVITAIGARLTDAKGNSIENQLTDKDGNPVACVITKAEKIEGVSVGEHTVTLKFAGSYNYKPSTATFTVEITKAPASMELPSVNVTYGEDYSAAPSITLGNKYGEKSEITDSMIQFLIGLDIAELDANEDGVTGLTGQMQLILPPALQAQLDAVFGEEGADMTLTGLKNYLSMIDDDSLGILTQAIEAIEGITETGDITITVGGAMPTDIGAYLYGAVSTASNYETAYDVGYIIIRPDAERVYLDWNNHDDNGIYTWELLQHGFDFNASAYSDEAFTALNEEATEKTHELFFGLDDQGNVVAELDKITDAAELGNGAFMEIAFLTDDFGNAFYYAVPIVRPVVIAPNMLTVEIVDANDNGVLLREFNNKPYAVDVKVYGADGKEIVPVEDQLTVTYVGIQTNTKTYNSTEAPKHAGTYLITATYTVNNGNDVTAMGMDVATLIIGPSQSTIDVAEKIVEVGENYQLQETLITVDSVNTDLTPDTTVISAAINSDGTFSESGWEAIEGNVNVDFPAWLDEILSAQFPGAYANGVNASDFIAKIDQYAPVITSKLEEQGAANEILNSFANMINSVISVLEQIPEDATLTFQDDISVVNVGAYAVVGIVTDSDHYPSVDAGILVIIPDVDLVKLEWNYEDENGIWTRELLNHFDLDATAFDAETGDKNAEATGKITYQFIGIDKTGEMTVTNDASKLPNGAYIELAYIELKVDGEMVISDMIARPVVIVPSTAVVEFLDKNGDVNPDQWFVFDNTAKKMDVRVTINGKVITPAADTLTVTYIGVQINGKTYNSTEAPTHAGVYTVIATYSDFAENGSTAHVGAAMGIMAIEPAEASIVVNDVIVKHEDKTAQVYNLAELLDIQVESLTSGQTPDTTVITASIATSGDFSEDGWDAVAGNVNIDFPNWVDALLMEHTPSIYDGVTAAEFNAKVTAKIPSVIEKIEAFLAEYGAEADLADLGNNLTAVLTEVQAIVDQLPENIDVTFHETDELTAKGIGAYAVVGIVTDSDHYSVMDTGIVVIVPDVDQVFLKWNYEDENNIWTRELLSHFDLYASAYDDEAFQYPYTDKDYEITYQFIGIDKTGEMIVTNDVSKLPNGAYIQLAYIEFELAGEMVIGDMIARPVVIVPGTATVEFLDKNGNVNPDQMFVFDNTAKKMDVRVTINGEVITPAEGTVTVTYIGVQTNGKTYNSTEAPTHAGVYTVIATYADAAENGSTAHVGAAMGIMAIEPAAATIDVSGMAGDDAITYDGKGHGVSTGDVTVTVNGKSNADHTLISGGAYVSGDMDEIGVDAFHGNVNIDFPEWLDEALADTEAFDEGIDTAYLIDFITSYRDDLVNLIPAEAMVELGLVTQDEVAGYIDQLNAYVDQLLAVLEKLPKGVSLTFADDVTYTEPGYYFYYGIVTDSDHYPAADTGLLVIEKNEMVFDLLDTTVTYNGEEQFVAVNNAQNADYTSIIIDRARNTMNIVLDEDAQYLLNTLLRILDTEFDGDVQLSTILEKYSGAEIAAAMVELIDQMEVLELPEEIQNTLTAVQTELKKVEQVGDVTITVNGALPTEVGAYEIYAISYAQYYNVQASEATLTITEKAEEEITYNVKNYTGKSDAETWTITKSENRINVRNDLACVVLIEHTDGTYTRLTAVAKDDGSYDFDISAIKDGEWIVIAVKGDIDNDGEIEGLEAVQIKAAQLGKLTTFTELQTIVSDLDGDGEIEGLEAVQIKAAQLNKLNLNW